METLGTLEETDQSLLVEEIGLKLCQSEMDDLNLLKPYESKRPTKLSLTPHKYKLSWSGNT